MRHPNSNLPPTSRRLYTIVDKIGLPNAKGAEEAPRACEFQRSDVNPSAARPKCSHDFQCLFFASLQKGLRCRCQRANRLLSVGTTSSLHQDIMRQQDLLRHSLARLFAEHLSCRGTHEERPQPVLISQHN